MKPEVEQDAQPVVVIARGVGNALVGLLVVEAAALAIAQVTGASAGLLLTIGATAVYALAGFRAGRAGGSPALGFATALLAYLLTIPLRVIAGGALEVRTSLVGAWFAAAVGAVAGAVGALPRRDEVQPSSGAPRRAGRAGGRSGAGRAASVPERGAGRGGKQGPARRRPRR